MHALVSISQQTFSKYMLGRLVDLEVAQADDFLRYVNEFLVKLLEKHDCVKKRVER